MRYKIVIDSCGELLDEWKNDERFESVPLTLMVGAEQIIDDETFNQADFLKKVAACPECPKSACPSPERYMRAYNCEAEHIYAVTLSSELSGSYNSALLGRNLVLEDHPEKKIHVFNSRSASIGQSLIGMKIRECEEAGMSFEDVVETVEHYIEGQHTFFVLENLDTLRKNGRGKFLMCKFFADIYRFNFTDQNLGFRRNCNASHFSDSSCFLTYDLGI